MTTIRIDPSRVTHFGSGLHRPEGVVAARDGVIWAADSRGGCARITRDGQVTVVGQLGGVPNGICLDPEGNVIVANIGTGEVQRLSPNGEHTVLATHADGRALTTPNFPFLDRQGRFWVSHSTDARPNRQAVFDPRPDGALAVIEHGRATVGRPGPFRRLFQVQKSLKPDHCHRITVGGWTKETASVQPLHRRDSRTQNRRSEVRRRGFRTPGSGAS